ncbi:hypothetical protein HPC49_03525 [Pyxidicoccus fallax]|uniref:Transglycosylase domain-containing protein n=1 Tax=Pyxidicoccus fallax TaxID=394095 RepID=A0A848LA78_9BACT|nr:transglycosylase domain-containing protein [Pyxidicoccus fallax]NMO15789.1 transglycosylase domain-containing protein [Pyxidicoccus fallax]NPC77327.1 hypothetical protein [Pyxidicoccus fallax]
MRWLGLTAALWVLGPLAAVEGLYRYGLSQVGALPPAPPSSALTETTRAVLWMGLGEELPPTVEAIWPWHTLAAFHERRWRHPGSQAARRVARLWLSREEQPRKGMALWHLTSWATTVRLTRHWSAAELTQVLARDLYFGPGTRGLESAAQTCFGMDAASLSTEQVAFLMAVADSPPHGRLAPSRGTA